MLAFSFCGTKGLGEYIMIKPGCFVKLLAFRFCHTPKSVQPSEGRFKADSGVEIKFASFLGRTASRGGHWGF